MPSKTARTNNRPGRTFSGCLTCRKRKVKCDSQLSPCGNCKRMKLSCRASFWTNFIDSAPAYSRARQDVMSSPVSEGNTTSPREFQSPQSAGEEEPAHAPSAIAMGSQDKIPAELDQNPNGDAEDPRSPNIPCDTTQVGQVYSEEILATIANGFLFNTGWHQLDLDGFEPFHNESFSAPTSHEFTLGERQFDPRLVEMASGDLIPLESIASWPQAPCNSYNKVASPTEISNSQTSIMSTEQHLANSNADIELSHFQEIPASSLDTLILPHQFPTAPMSTESPLIRHYEAFMAKFLSVKDPQWNLYTYMLRSPQGSSESPLRYSLLAWSAFHISTLKKSSPHEGARYYHAASSTVNDLTKEFTNPNGRIILSERLRMLLSATFFLCYSDIMACQPNQLFARIRALKIAISSNWEPIYSALSPITSRLLIWISYLEIRASLWGGLETNPDRCSSEKLLLDMLSDRVSLTSFYTRSGSYLQECFGEQYPTSELNHDLQQEAGNLKLLDIMSVLGQIVTFERWQRNMDLENSGPASAMMHELRITKVRLLQAEIARIRAECHQASPTSHIHATDSIDRTSFHWLTVKALYLSATILLSRLLHPNVRTDRDSQEAASELLRIARRLRRTRYLQTPRSFIWPLPIFIAGIETTDELYQDWVVEYLREMSGWGKNMGWVRRVLKGVVERQGREERRVGVRHVMEDLGCVMVV